MTDKYISDEEKLNHILWEFFLEDIYGVIHLQRMEGECDDDLRRRYRQKKMKVQGWGR